MLPIKQYFECYEQKIELPNGKLLMCTAGIEPLQLDLTHYQ